MKQKQMIVRLLDVEGNRILELRQGDKVTFTCSRTMTIDGDTTSQQVRGSMKVGEFEVIDFKEAE